MCHATSPPAQERIFSCQELLEENPFTESQDLRGRGRTLAAMWLGRATCESFERSKSESLHMRLEFATTVCGCLHLQFKY